LESHRKRLREAFGNTMSDEFVDVRLGKLVEALRPGPFDALEEPTLNAALAIIDSMQPQSELEALLAVQIIAAGFSGLRLLRQSQQHMTEEFIEVYGTYAVKLLRLQNQDRAIARSWGAGGPSPNRRAVRPKRRRTSPAPLGQGLQGDDSAWKFPGPNERPSRRIAAC
jgi:hypothetical protein